MRRKILIALLAAGTFGGYAAGFASLHCARTRHHETFEQRVARTCVDAARHAEPGSR